ncbi:MAG: endonuclease III [bacterium]
MNTQRAQTEALRRQRILRGLAELYPEASIALHFRNPYELLIATILSAQSTDKTVNAVTPALFEKYPNARTLAVAVPSELEVMIHRTGFFRNKTKNLLRCAQTLVQEHGGEVPQTMEKLVILPGVGRKTANVVLGNAFGKNEGVVVDTHVQRLAQRMGFTQQTQPEKIEQDLMAIVPRKDWTIFAHRLILHGRQICQARRPKCPECSLAPDCPSRQAYYENL